MFVDSLNEVANSLRDCTRSTVALSELLTWVRGNGVRLIEVLAADEVCTAQRLPSRLSQVINLSLDPADHIYSNYPRRSIIFENLYCCRKACLLSGSLACIHIIIVYE
ncbi:hypothetical protein COOONC_10187 [Cooperia oncophora]